MPKMHQNTFGGRDRPDPLGELTRSLPLSRHAAIGAYLGKEGWGGRDVRGLIIRG